MRQRGKITRWDDDRGFGFVTDDEGGEEAFLHVSALPKRAVRPVLGDPVTYELQRDRQGRLQAIHVDHVDGRVAAPATKNPAHHRHARAPQSGTRTAGWTWIVLLLLVVGSVAGVAHRQGRLPWADIASSRLTGDNGSSRFTCGKKTYCDQMGSCDEARFYLDHCPGTKMDGDRDGRPCEDWCGH